MEEATSFLYSLLYPYYFLFHVISLSLPFAVWIEYEIVIDIDTALIPLHGSKGKNCD
jgi:hypothetical protein